MRFCSTGNSAAVAEMGETKPFTVAGHPMRVRNLRSFLSGNLDANFDWAYWVAP